MRVLNRLFYIDNDKVNLPVAFATNTLYVLARNGLCTTPETQELISTHLLPLVHAKKDWMSCEGISQTVFALAEAGCWDQNTWDMLKERIESKDFDYQVVKSSRWDPTAFVTLTGREHLLEAEINPFTRNLFYEGKNRLTNSSVDKLNFFELYNGVVKANEEKPSLGLQDTLLNLEEKYSFLINQNEEYLRLDHRPDASA